MKRPKLPRPTRVAKGIGFCRHKNKAQYPSEAAANKAVVFIWSRDNTVGINDLHSYLCPVCGKYHVGHRDPRFEDTVSNP